ncbi:hypothetical protein EU245_11110 [Lentibacillus lipolyticus]|nr:hypothetical protein EU245_11110 [Lentibacillus lipolyticus]
MNKKQFGILFSILVLVAGGILLWHRPESPTSPTVDTSSQKEQKADEAERDKAKDNQTQVEEDQPEEKGQEPVSQLQDLLNEAAQRTKDFFTKKQMHVTAIGDSLTQGVGDNVVEGGYVGILESKINQNEQLVTFDNYGKRGNRSDQLLKRLDKPEIMQSIKKADIILITIGANDIMHVLKQNFTNLEMSDFEQPQERYKTRLKDIFQMVRDLNDDAAIYLIGFYNPFGRYFQDIEELNTIINNWNQTGQTVTEQFDRTKFIPIADLFRSTDIDDNVLADDHFHPNHRGYQLFAKRVLDYITDQ